MCPPTATRCVARPAALSFGATTPRSPKRLLPPHAATSAAAATTPGMVFVYFYPNILCAASRTHGGTTWTSTWYADKVMRRCMQK